MAILIIKGVQVYIAATTTLLKSLIESNVKKEVIHQTLYHIPSFIN